MGNYAINRQTFNELKTLLIENGFDLEVIAIDHNDKFYSPPKDFERTFGNPEERYKDHQGKLAALCTKAIRDLNLILHKQNSPKKEDPIKTIVRTETVYPPTSYKLLRNGLFWTILLGLLSLSCLGFYYLGQNSKEKENAELVNQNSEYKTEIQTLEQRVEKNLQNLKACADEKEILKSKLKLKEEKTVANKTYK